MRAYLLIALIMAGLEGCGTTHYFVPSRPLGEEESAVYVTWHYDLNGLYTPSPVPDIHVYYGVNEDWNLGIGLQAPIYISHLSAVEYWSNDDDFTYGFLHLGQVAGTNTNPLIELGAGHVWNQESTAEQAELGLAYGNGSAAPLAMTAMSTEFSGGNRLMPLGRVQVTGKDAGVSLQYYHGLTRANLYNLEQVATEDRVELPERVNAGNLDSIAFFPDSVSDYGTAHLILFLSSGWQIDLFEKPALRYFDRRSSIDRVLPFDQYHQLPAVPVDSLPYMQCSAFGGRGNGVVSFVGPEQPFIGDADSIAAAVNRGEEVQLRSYRDVQAEILRRWRNDKRGFWNDLSVGAAVISASE